VASLFVIHAIYIRVLFEGFRRKVYLDVLDFLVTRHKKESKIIHDDDDDDDDPKPKRGHLRLL
jgi:hypothetical protein